MAKQIIQKLIDDLDGGEADGTVTFAFDGMTYEIDLSEKNEANFRKLMAPFMDAGTRVGKALSTSATIRQAKQTKTATTAQNREWNTKVREWAAANGYEVNDRGRIPVYIVDAYESQTPNPEWLAAQEAAKAVQDEVTETKPRKRTPRKAAPAAAFQS